MPTTAQTTQSAAGPTSERERIFALDVLRGIAVLGILWMNIIGFGLPNAYLNPANAGGTEGADFAVWVASSLFLEGTMRGLFTLLFGAGVVLYASRLEAAGLGLRSADYYFRRTIWLVVFGLVNAYLLLWNGDILFTYGIVGLFLWVFRDLSARTLLRIAVPVLCLQTVVATADLFELRDLSARAATAQQLRDGGAELDPEQESAIEDYEERMSHERPTAEEQARVVKAMRGGYASAFGENAKFAWWMQTEYLHALAFWEVLGMMLLGMALLKSGALTGDWPARHYLTMLVVGWSIGITVNAVEIAWQLRNDFSVDSVLTVWSLSYDLGRIPLTLGHLACVLLLLRSGALRRSFGVLAQVGRMALTNYLAQSVLCLFVFTGVGFALFGQLQRHELYYVVAAIWALQLAWSPWWLARFRFGPMEWLWRSLTRWQRQPLRRRPELVAASD